MARRYKKSYDYDALALFYTMLLFFALSLIFKYYIYILIIGGLILLYIIVRLIINSDIFGKFKKVVIYHNGNSLEEEILKLQELPKSDANAYKINCLKKGIYGENKLLYVLEHSDIPMYVLHDLTLKYDEFKAQIDFIVITKRNIFVIEAKDLKGNLDIESDGTFTRKLGRYKKGIKNPLTQNKEHEIVLNKILKQEKLRIKYKTLVVLTNDNAYINYKKGSRESYKNVIRNDQLYNYIKKIEKKSNICRNENKIKLICDKLLKYNT